MAAAAREAKTKLSALKVQQDEPLYVDWGETGAYPHTVGQSAAIVKAEWMTVVAPLSSHRSDSTPLGSRLDPALENRSELRRYLQWLTYFSMNSAR